MGVFDVTGRLSGKTYSATISGEVPTADETARIQQYIMQEEAKFAESYSKNFGQAPSPNDGTAIGRGVGQRLQSVKSGFGELAQTIGQRTGLGSLADYGTAVEQSADRQAARLALEQPAPLSYRDVNSLGTAATYVGEMAGSAGVDIGGAVAGTLAGYLAAPVIGAGAVTAGALGAGLTTLGITAGDILQESETINGEGNASLGWALGGGGAVAAMDTLSLGILGKLGVGKAVLKALSGEVGQNLTARLLTGAVEGTAVEGTTEVLQEITAMIAAGVDPNSPDIAERLTGAFIGGGVLGGLLGGAGRGAFGKRPEAATPPPSAPAPKTTLGTPPAGASTTPALVSSVQKATTGGATTTKITLNDGTVISAPADATQDQIDAAVADYNKSKIAPTVQDTTSISDTMTPEELAALDAEAAGAPPEQVLKATLDSIGLPAHSGGYRALLKMGESPTSEVTLKVLEDQLKYYNKTVVEGLDPTVPGRIRAYIDATRAAKQTVAPTVEAPAVDQGTAETAPATETSVAETSVAETPVAETPVAETPVASSLTDAQQTEINVRQQQSKMGTLEGNTGAAGPLFDTQSDLFATAATKPAAEVPAVDSVAVNTKPSTQRGPDRVHKYPLSRALGGIRPGSALAKTLEAAYGRKLPSAMYAKAGQGVDAFDQALGALDSGSGYRQVLEVDPTGNAFEEKSLVDALIREVNGDPLYVDEQAVKAQIRSDKERALRDKEAGIQAEAPVIEPLSPELDIRTDAEKYADEQRAQNEALQTGLNTSEVPFGDEVGVVPTNQVEFIDWLEGEADALPAEDKSPIRTIVKKINKAQRDIVRKVKRANRYTADITLEDGIEAQRPILAARIVAHWEKRVQALTEGVQEIVRDFSLNPEDVVDPTTVRDLRIVEELVAVKDRVNPTTKPLMASLQYHVFAKAYFDKFPTVAEGLELIARDLVGNVKDKRINNTEQVGLLENWTIDGVELKNWSEASAFFDSGTGYEAAVKAMEWVKANLSPEAGAYVKASMAEQAKIDRVARRYVINAANLIARRDKLEATRAKNLNLVKEDGSRVTLEDVADASEREAAPKAFANYELVSGKLVKVANVPGNLSLDAITATEGRTNAVPRRKGESGVDYAIRVMRPELTDAQRAALSGAEVLVILSEAARVREFLGGKLFSKADARQAYRMHQPLDPLAINVLRSGNLATALRYVATRVNDPRIAAMANLLAANVGNTKIAILNADNPHLLESEAAALADSYGLYYPKYDTVVLNRSTGLTVSTLLHEVWHAVTVAELSKPNSPLRIEMQRVFDAVVDDIAHLMPGQLTVEEFVAELKVNPDLRAAVAQLSADGFNLPQKAQGKSILEWVKDLYTQFVKRLQRNTRRPNLLEHSDTLIDMLVTPERNSSADIMYAANSGAGGSHIMDGIRAGVKATSRDAQNTRRRLADDSNAMLDSGVNLGREGLLGLLPTLQVADMANELGLDNPYAMLHTIQTMEGRMAKDVARVKAMKTVLDTYMVKNPVMAENLDAVAHNMSMEQVDVTRDRSTYDHFWLAYETLDAKGNITGRRSLKFKNALDRDNMVARLNTATPNTRSTARASYNVDPDRIAAYDRLKGQYNDSTFLDDAGRDRFVALRDFYKKERQTFWDALNGNIDSFGLPADITSKIKKSAYVSVFGIGDIDPYFPFVREGDYWLEFAEYNPVTKSTEPVKKTFESAPARDRFIAWLKEQPNSAKDAEGNPIVTAYTQTEFATKGFRAAKDPMAAATILNVMNEYNAKNSGNPKKNIPPDVIEQIATAIVEMAPEGSLAKQFHRRTNTAGHNESLSLGLEKKGYSIANAATRYVFSKAIRGLQKDYATAAANTNITSSKDGPKKVAVLGELAKLGASALDPQNSLSDHAARLANKLTYSYTLAGSVAGALVNTTSMASIVAPQLGGTYGWGAAVTAITRASGDFMGSGFKRTSMLPVAVGTQTSTTDTAMPSLDNYYIVGTDGNFTLNTSLDLTPAQAKRAADLLPLAQLMSERGMSNHSMLYDSAGLAEVGKGTSLFNRVLAFAGAPFNMVERMNRQVTAIATYDLELARMDKTPTPDELLLSPAEKQAKAAGKALYTTQLLNGSASMSTAPRYSQRGIGRVALMYKGYGLTVSTLLYKTARQIIENAFPGKDAASKAMRDTAMKQMVGHIGVTLAMAGVHGLPLFGLYAFVGNLLRGDDELPIEEATRLWMGELMYKGALNHATGFEIADRVGLSYLLYRSNRFNADPSAEETLVQNVLGAPWSTFTRVKRGVTDVLSGEYMRGVEAMTPVAISNMLQTMRFASEGGVRTRQNNFMLEDPSAFGLAGKFLGFNMAELTRRQERATTMSQIGKAVQTARTKILMQLYLAKRTGDRSGYADAMATLREFNSTVARRYPDAFISDETIKKSMKQREKNNSEMVNAVSVNPQVRDVLIETYNAQVDGQTTD